MRSKVISINKKNIERFTYGKLVQETFVNWFRSSTFYTVKPRGVENSFYDHTEHILKSSYRGHNTVSTLNALEARYEPDLKLFHQRKFINETVEIKCRRIIDCESLLDSERNTIENVISFHPRTKFIYCDLASKKIVSIDGFLPLEREHQQIYFDSPWYWIEDLDEQSFNFSSKKFIFDAIEDTANMIMSKYAIYNLSVALNKNPFDPSLSEETQK